MNTELLQKAFQDFADADYQAVLAGDAIKVVQDKTLELGKTDDAFVIYELGDESFDSVAALKAHLVAEAEPMLKEYYQYNPVSREYFQAQLTEHMNTLGDMAFVAMPKKPAEYVIFVDDGKVIVEGRDSARHKYGMYCSLDEDYQPAARANKVKNWIQSGTAYGDYISINVCRFSSME